MPIYKMKGSKDGRQKYRVRVNYIDNLGKNRQIDRVAYGSAEAKEEFRAYFISFYVFLNLLQTPLLSHL